MNKRAKVALVASIALLGAVLSFWATWQIFSRAYVGLVIASGLGTWFTRGSKTRKIHLLAMYAFQMVLLGFVLIFLYLLFHEGGHTLGAMCFGHYDFARSDFWGLHGSPHSGFKWDASTKPWQMAIESIGGPALPTLIGWALFLVWRSRLGKRMRESRPFVNLCFSAIVAISVFPFVAVAGCLLGVIHDADWNYFIRNVPDPWGLAKILPWGILLANAYILWRLAPELRKAQRGLRTAMETSLRRSGGIE